MTADREMERIVRSWLAVDEHESADRLLDAVFGRLDTTPQRRALWPAGRFDGMNTFARFALAATAVLVVAVIGISVLPGRGGPSGGATATPTPSPTTFASSAPSAGISTIVSGPLEAGTRYLVPVSPFRQVPVSLVLPTDDWTLDGEWLHRLGSTEVSLYGGGTASVPGIFTDPCAHTGLRQFEDSVAGQAAAVAALRGVEVVGPPVGVVVDGRDAQTVAITVPADIGCRNDQFWLSYDPECGVKVECTEYPTWLDSRLRYWFIDLGAGKRFTIRAETHGTGASDADLDAAIRQLVDSVRFES